MLSCNCYSVSLFGNDDKASSYQYMKKLNYMFDFIQQNYVDELDPKTLYEGALKGMLDSIGDPYTLYLDESYMRDLDETTTGSFGGVGLSISKAIESTPEKPAYVEVSSPIEDTPGYKAGIQSGDSIIAIDGHSTVEMTMNDVLVALRGDVGTDVVLTILRGNNMKFDVKLTRALIEVPTVKYGMIEGTKVGYIRLIQFTPETPKRVQNAIDSFKEQNYEKLIIDVRDNPGGLLASATDIADKLIDEGPIVTTKSRLLFENQVFSASKDKTTISKDIPVVVLMNNGSASASEVLAGALKDYHLAYLIGEKTYGKGSVQQVSHLSDIDGIKITMARYYSPSDTNIDKIGILPDLEVKNFNISEDEEKVYLDLINSKKINDFVDKNSNLTEAQISAEAELLKKEYPLDSRLLRRLIRVQVLNSKPAILYDLDFDLQLQKALEVLDRKDFSEMLKKTKTLSELQAEYQEANQTESKVEKK